MKNSESDHAVLLAVDATEASRRAVEYVGEILGSGDGRLVLLHVLPPIPPALLEFAGSTDSDEEIQVEDEMESTQQAWIREREEEFRPTFERDLETLVGHGVEREKLSLRCAVAMPEDKPSKLILSVAKETECDTICVGRSALPWYRDIFHHHLGRILAEHAEDSSVWIVG